MDLRRTTLLVLDDWVPGVAARPGELAPAAASPQHRLTTSADRLSASPQEALNAIDVLGAEAAAGRR